MLMLLLILKLMLDLGPRRDLPPEWADKKRTVNDKSTRPCIENLPWLETRGANGSGRQVLKNCRHRNMSFSKCESASSSLVDRDHRSDCRCAVVSRLRPVLEDSPTLDWRHAVISVLHWRPGPPLLVSGWFAVTTSQKQLLHFPRLCHVAPASLGCVRPRPHNPHLQIPSCLLHPKRMC